MKQLHRNDSRWLLEYKLTVSHSLTPFRQIQLQPNLCDANVVFMLVIRDMSLLLTFYCVTDDPLSAYLHGFNSRPT